MALNVEFNHQSKRVKVTPGTTMFQVLADAREHFRLSDSRQYQLLHRNRPIDLSIPFRLTGISNNASVELKELEGAAEVQQVRVCVQLRDGKRVQAPFGSDATIERILTFFKLLPAPEQFSLAFLRREIEFPAFATITLQELGILSGSAMFRVQSADGQATSAAPIIQNSISPPQKSHVSSAPTTETSKEAPPSPLPSAAVVATPSEVLRDVFPAQDGDIEMKDADEKAPDGDVASVSSFDALQLLRDNSFDAVSRTAIVTLMKIVTNILSDPENEKIRAIRLSNAAFHRSVGQVKGGLEFLQSIGFALVPETQAIVLNPSPQDKIVLEEGLRLLSVEADDLNISPDTRPVVREKRSDPNFNVFKTQITRVQMQPRGPSTTEVLVDALKSKQDQLVGQDKPSRNTTVALHGRRTGEISEPFPGAIESELSERSDAQLLISSLKARREEMEKTKNFRTQAMRELDELKRKKVFQTALIRVQFPDRAVMQASFHPNETIRDVMDHVAGCLSEQYKRAQFYLYVTPPMQKMAPTKTLVELNLVPAALMYLTWLELPPQVGVTGIGFYLRSDLLADEDAEPKERLDPLQKTEYPKPLHLENPSTTVTSEPLVDSKRQPSSSAQAKTGKKPSWLKL
ncbi:Tether containing UBX domain for GLUT4 [Phytophthora cinnamomi]|uniref:Tether containing UBX domain for GLUT4 n=1 Tax=Phytophthora cinnamomi TaxID=4785 RepID=UPI00355A0390|nr:Tether containing UBX domain for GLUT4 [Phytophthora cinnamomi]